MFAQLGNTVFQNLKSFDGYSKKGSAIFAQHNLLDGKPRLQFTGLGLDELSMTIHFHATFCNPADELNKLKTSRDTAEVLGLLYGNGDVGGNYVITELTDVIEQADPQGNLFSINVSISLKEYVVPDKQQQQQQANRDNAKAVGSNNPVVKPKINPSTCAQNISSVVSGIKAHAGGINTVVLIQGNVDTASNTNTITQHLVAITKLAQTLINSSNDPTSCASSQADLGDAAENLYAIANNWQLNGSDSATDAAAQNTSLQSAVSQTEAAARALTNQSITGQP
jgi:phage protein U